MIESLEQPSPLSPVPDHTAANAGALFEGWGKTVHESRSHYFVNGRALCRLFYLEEGRELSDVPTGDTCGCCARTLADRPVPPGKMLDRLAIELAEKVSSETGCAPESVLEDIVRTGEQVQAERLEVQA